MGSNMFGRRGWFVETSKQRGIALLVGIFEDIPDRY